MPNQSEKLIDRASEALDKSGRTDQSLIIGSGCDPETVNRIADVLYPPQAHRGGVYPRKTRARIVNDSI